MLFELLAIASVKGNLDKQLLLELGIGFALKEVGQQGERRLIKIVSTCGPSWQPLPLLVLRFIVLPRLREGDQPLPAKTTRCSI